MARVGLIESVNDKHVRFLGYGEYVGDVAVDPAEFGLLDIEILAPKFNLDDGRSVTGTNYWWCEEAQMIEKLKEYSDNGYVIENI